MVTAASLMPFHKAMAVVGVQHHAAETEDRPAFLRFLKNVRIGTQWKNHKRLVKSDTFYSICSSRIANPFIIVIKH